MVDRKLKAKAAAAGVSVSEYLRRYIREPPEPLTREELIHKLESLPPVITKKSSAQVLREEREKRGRRLSKS